MKPLAKISAVIGFLFVSLSAFAQLDTRDISQYRYRDFRGINQFEALDRSIPWDGFKVRLGGAFAVQMQALSHSNGSTDTLALIGNNFNLPTANLDVDVALADGMRMHLRTYLSARHHPESWVKGGYIQIHNLNWISEGLLENIMDITTIKMGLMEINYGDMHFRRTDNARAIYNPFVGNLIMDAFNTEAGAEIYLTPGDFIFMVGATNGKLNQSVATDTVTPYTPAFLAKVGWDKQMNDDLRVRLTTSLYTSAEGKTNYLYFGDRGGSRYYLVMEPQGSSPVSSYRSGRWSPSFINQVTSIMVNPFVKYKGLEFLGAFETTSGMISNEVETRTYTQIYGELVYRFGADEQYYVGGRYYTVSGQLPNFNPTVSATEISISRFAIAAGWYMTPNVMLKAEYVNQDYNDFPATGGNSIFNDGNFNGAVLEATISF
jgi:hypothetical protein